MRHLFQSRSIKRTVKLWQPELPTQMSRLRHLASARRCTPHQVRQQCLHSLANAPLPTEATKPVVFAVGALLQLKPVKCL